MADFQIDDNISSDDYNVWAIAMGITPNNSGVYYAWTETYPDNLLIPGRVRFRKGTNNGSTLGSPVTVDSPFTPLHLDMTSIDTSGVYLAWSNQIAQNTFELMFNKSSNEGTDWDSNSSILDTSNGNILFDRTNLTLNSAGNLYLHYVANGQLKFISSYNGGTTWTSIKTLYNSSAISTPPRLASDNSGHAYIAWIAKGNQGFYHNKLMFTMSGNSGRRWVPNAQTLFETLADFNSMDFDIAADNYDNVFIVYKVLDSSNPQGTHLFLIRSSDNGLTWGDPVRITVTPFQGTGTPHIIAVSNSSASNTKLYVQWHDINGFTNQVFFRKSTDSGTNWGDLKTLINYVGDGTFADLQETFMRRTPSKLIVSWRKHIFATDVIQIRYQLSSDDGDTWAADATTASDDGTGELGTIRGVLTIHNRFVPGWHDTGNGDNSHLRLWANSKAI